MSKSESSDLKDPKLLAHKAATVSQALSSALVAAPSSVGYFKIRVDFLIPDHSTTFDTYIMINNRMVLYLRAGDALAANKIAHLERADVFYVPDAQRSHFKRYVFDRMNEIGLDVKVKANVLRESSITLAEEIFEKEDVEEALLDSRELITNFIDFMQEEPTAMSYLVGLSSPDFYTYNHLVLGRFLVTPAPTSLNLGEELCFTISENATSMQRLSANKVHSAIPSGRRCRNIHSMDSRF